MFHRAFSNVAESKGYGSEANDSLSQTHHQAIESYCCSPETVASFSIVAANEYVDNDENRQFRRPATKQRAETVLAHNSWPTCSERNTALAELNSKIQGVRHDAPSTSQPHAITM
jgi:hypothetical protein